jgi:3-isopropylmalate/(R)-2-methylmalate dehydratase small subunit
MILKGKAWKFGDGISTDHIQPSKYFHLRGNLPELAKHVLEGAREDFPTLFKTGDFVVGGRNFGLGSSREHAPTIVKLAGLNAVLAKSFARIFFRNAINVGLPLIMCDTDGIGEGDELEVDLEEGMVRNKSRGGQIPFSPLPPFMVRILNDGGLLHHIKKHGDFKIAQ